MYLSFIFVRISRNILFEILSVAEAAAKFSDHDFKKIISLDTVAKTMGSRDPGLAIGVQNAKQLLGEDDESN